MTSSGWVWLVRDGNGNLGILPTFGSGTVLVQNRLQMGSNESILGFKKSEDQNPLSSSNNEDSSITIGGGDRDTTSGDRFKTVANIHNQRDPLHSTTRNNGNRNSNLRDGEELFPLLCLSVMEHAWLPDYGMWGKERYLINFWDCVDWNVVQKRWEEYQP